MIWYYVGSKYGFWSFEFFPTLRRHSSFASNVDLPPGLLFITPATCVCCGAIWHHSASWGRDAQVDATVASNPSVTRKLSMRTRAASPRSPSSLFFVLLGGHKVYEYDYDYDYDYDCDCDCEYTSSSPSIAIHRGVTIVPGNPPTWPQPTKQIQCDSSRFAWNSPNRMLLFRNAKTISLRKNNLGS